MQTLDSQLPFPTLDSNDIGHSFVLRRNVRIKSSRLPSDFFNSLSFSTPRGRPIGTDLSNRQPQTPSFRCRDRYSSATQDTIDEERKVETARPSLDKTYQPEHPVLSLMTSSRKPSSKSRCKGEIKQGGTINFDGHHLRLPRLPRIPNLGLLKKCSLQ